LRPEFCDLLCTLGIQAGDFLEGVVCLGGLFIGRVQCVPISEDNDLYIQLFHLVDADNIGVDTLEYRKI
jgi:hypothetical protein